MSAASAVSPSTTTPAPAPSVSAPAPSASNPGPSVSVRSSTSSLPLVPLGPLESQVMGILWESGPATTGEIIARLEDGRAYSTIATVTTHLEEKGLLVRVRAGRSVQFHPTLTRGEYCASMMRGILDAGGNRADAIRCFVDILEPEDLTVLRECLERRGGS